MFVCAFDELSGCDIEISIVLVTLVAVGAEGSVDFEDGEGMCKAVTLG